MTYQPFLHKVATRYWERVSQNPSQVNEFVILPTQRACMYFKYYLSQIANQTVLAPLTLTPDDFFNRVAELEQPDEMTLLFKLYQIYKQFDKNPKHDLENFSPLGIAILRDFNTIDKNLSQEIAEKLFEHLRDVKRIEAWAESLIENNTIAKYKYLNEYFKFWEYLYETYKAFQKHLEDENKGYAGMIFRRVAEKMDTLASSANIGFVTVAGFHQFTKAEQKIWTCLHQHHKLALYLDSDSYYIKNPLHEAGQGLRHTMHWLESIGYTLDEEFEQNHILPADQNHQKEITYIAANYSVLQSKIAGNWLAQRTKNEWQKTSFRKTPNKIAVVLPEYNLLHTFLHSLPQPLIDAQAQTYQATREHLINITMGFEMKYAQVYQWLKLVFNLQLGQRCDNEKSSYYHQDTIALLLHPIVRHTENSEIINQLLHQIRSQGLVYVPEKMLTEAENTLLIPFLFASWQDNIPKAIQKMNECIVCINNTLTAPEQATERAFLLKLYTTLRQFSGLVNQNPEMFNIRTFEHFLLETIKTMSLPFTGEPISPIQVLGLLETRALDFDEVIILSCNEGVLPQGKVADSLIPFDIRQKFKLPTYQETDSTYSYLFYRLLQKANHITLIYTDVKGSIDSRIKEPSRYLLQIKEELASKPFVKLQEIQPPVMIPESLTQIGIAKTSQILDLVKDKLRRGISPTALATFLKDPREFFIRFVMKIEETTQIEENLDSRTFGTLLHDTLEQIFKTIKSQNPMLTPESLQKYTQNPSSLLEKIIVSSFIHRFQQLPHNIGKNFLAKQVTAQLVTKFLSNEIKMLQEGNRLEIIALETPLEHTLPILIGDEIVEIRLYGVADRIDLHNGELRVVDYKTGSYRREDLEATSAEELWQGDKNGKIKEKIIQLLLYKYLVLKDSSKINYALSDQFPKAGFYFFRKLTDGFISYQLDDEPSTHEDFFKYVEKVIGQIVSMMLNTEKTF